MRWDDPREGMPLKGDDRSKITVDRFTYRLMQVAVSVSALGGLLRLIAWLA